MKIKLCLLLSIILVSCGAVRSQQIDLSLQVSDLRSADWQTRSDAYMKIKADQEALKRPEVKAALVELLDRENKVLRKASAKNNDSYAESYGEYVSYLADTVAEITDWSDQRQVCILASSPYDPGSQFASDLALKGGHIVIPCLLAMSHGSSGDRSQSIPVLVHSSAIESDIASDIQQRIRDAISSGLRDSNVLVRQATIEAVGKYGGQEMIPILQGIASSDPVSRRLNTGQLYFTVRESAAKAIRSIQERAKGGWPTL